MTHEAVFRVAGAPAWHELTRWQRCCLMLLDWPLFSAIRYKEIQRLRRHPLLRVGLEAYGVTLEPIEAQHRSRFFLNAIAHTVTQHGLKARASAQGLFHPDWLSATEVQIVGSDQRMIQYLYDNLLAGDLLSLEHFTRHIENAYASTLPEHERYAYITAMR